MKITQQIRIAVAALAVVGVGFSLFEITRVQGPAKNAQVLNQTGLVRGGTQRLVKLELAGQKNDDLIKGIETKIDVLINGGTVTTLDGEVNIAAAKEGPFKTEMLNVQELWKQLKNDLIQRRQNPNLAAKVVQDSESYFDATNKAAFAAEDIFAAGIGTERNLILLAILVQIILAAVVLVTVEQVSKTLQKAVSGVSGSSSQIAATVEEQGRIVSDQTASVNETTTTIEELGASSFQAAQQADASASSAQQALDLSDSGQKTVQETLDGIANLRSKVGDIAEKIMQLSEQTDQISTVSKLVADVADQTNMLALNAAVEAARAGEQGKGFAVVAGEIRKLADQSRNSADKIGTLVGTIQSSINSTVMVTDEGNKTADSGIKLAQDTLNVFQEIATAINEVSIASQQIALSSKQQAVGVQQAVSAMNAINLGAKETATVVSQVKSSTEELTEVAEKLQVTV